MLQLEKKKEQKEGWRREDRGQGLFKRIEKVHRINKFPKIMRRTMEKMGKLLRRKR